MPVVSALLVFHRDTPFLRPAIASLLNQTWRDLELLLVDNGTGLSPDALGPLGSDPRIRWIRLPRNEGIVGGHNAGLAAARSEFIALLDYDDVAQPHRLERQIAHLRSAPQVGLVSSLADAIDAEGRVLGREFAILEPAAQRRYTQYALPFFSPGCTGRRELFAALPYRTGFAYAGDFDFVSRAAERTEFAVIPEVLLHYRHHAGQVTVTWAALAAAERCVVRLLTARRRAGRPEGTDLLPVPGVTRHPADTCEDFARRCLAEGFATLAAYHARRMVAERRTPRDAFMAMRIFLQARGAAGAAERTAVTRMFFTGPVRSLGLRPSRNISAPAAG
jgi:GT2 family glycosyltransferase